MITLSVMLLMCSNVVLMFAVQWLISPRLLNLWIKTGVPVQIFRGPCQSSVQNLVWFQKTFDLRHDYFWNGTSYQQSENGIAKYSFSYII